MTLTLNCMMGFSSMVKLQHASRPSMAENSCLIWGRAAISLEPNSLGIRFGEKNFANGKGLGRILSTLDDDTSTNSESMDPQNYATDAQSSSSNMQPPTPKITDLPAREKLRAARVLSRFTESETRKPEMVSKFLEALRKSDGEKQDQACLPEVPTNLLDDSKHGLPKKGLTFDLPGGSDRFIIAFSFVFISTAMFATIYLVWKVGAIHLNEY